MPEALAGSCFVARVGAERRAYCWGEGPRGNFEPAKPATPPYHPPSRVLDGWDVGPISPTGDVYLAASSQLAVVAESTRTTFWCSDRLPALWGRTLGSGRRLLSTSTAPGPVYNGFVVSDELFCSGDSVVRCLGIVGSDLPALVSPTVDFVKGTLTQRRSPLQICGLVDTGSSLPAQRIRCWTPGMGVFTDVDTVDAKAVELVATEGNVFCARQAGGTVQCLGSGYLGDGLPPHAGIGTLGRKFTKLDASGCGLSEGDVYCFGPNTTGAVGDGTKTPQPTPTKVALPGKARLLSGTTVVLEAGAIYVWGPDRANAPPPKVPTAPLLPVRLEWE